MKKYYMGDEVNDQEVKAPDANKVLTIDSLRALVNEMSVMAEIEQRVSDVIVRIHDNIGTGQFLANAVDDHAWFKTRAYKKERRGPSTLYYLKLDK